MKKKQTRKQLARSKYLPESKPHKHSYAKKLLKDKGIEIYKGRKRIFTDENIPGTPPSFIVTEEKPTMKFGTFKKSSLIKNINYKELQELGYVINSYRKKSGSKRGKYFKEATHKIETITKKPTRGKTIKLQPVEVRIEYDPPQGAIRLTGRKETEWVYINKKSKSKNKEKITDYNILIRKARNPYLQITKKAKPKITKEIPELIMGISHNNHKLVCIPKLYDGLRMGFIGMQGEGKTIGMHSTIDQLYWHWGMPICLLNDIKPTSETGTWCLRTKSHLFKENIKKIGLTPKPLPIIYLYPSMKEQTKRLYPGEGISETISLSLNEFFKHYNDFTEGDKELQLGPSKRYLTDTKKEISKIKEAEELYNLIRENPETPKLSKRKIISVFKSLIGEEIFDIGTNNPSKWTIKKDLETKKLPPIIALMYAGVIPSLISRDLSGIQFGKKTTMHSSYLNYQIKEIFEHKKSGEVFKDQHIAIAIDELGQLLESGALKPVSTVVRIGRSEGINLLWAAQEYSTLPTTIKNNNDYLIAMRVGEELEWKKICKNYNGDETVRKDMNNLNTRKGIRFEAYLFHKRPIITYDLDDGKREIIENEPIRISLTLPMSEHKRPPKI